MRSESLTIVEAKRRALNSLRHTKKIDKDAVAAWVAWAYDQNGYAPPRIIYVKGPLETPHITTDDRVRSTDLKKHVARTLGRLSIDSLRDQRIKAAIHATINECSPITHGLIRIRDDESALHDKHIPKKYVTRELLYPHYGIKDLPVIVAVETSIAAGYEPNKAMREWWARYREYVDICAYGMALGKREAWVLERPRHYETTPDKQSLHSTRGPAITWGDGTKQHYLYGAMIQEETWRFATTTHPTIRDVLLSVDRHEIPVVMRTLGPEWFLDRAERVTRIHTTKRAALYEAKSNHLERAVHVAKYRCPSTNQTYYAYVPRTVTDADEATLWLHGLTKNDQGNMIET